MDKKKVLYHLGIRIAILIVLLAGLFGYRYFTYDAGPYRRHLDPKVGFYVSAFFLAQAYCLFLLLEMIYFFVKRNKNSGLINLAVLTIIEVIPAMVLLQLLV